METDMDFDRIRSELLRHYGPYAGAETFRPHVENLLTLNDERVAPFLCSLLAPDNRPELRQVAATGLGRIRGDNACDALSRALLSDQQWQVRRAAAESLGQICDKRSVPALVRATNDEEAWVRFYAGKALFEMGYYDEAESALKPLVGEDREYLAQCAQEELQSLAQRRNANGDPVPTSQSQSSRQVEARPAGEIDTSEPTSATVCWYAMINGRQHGPVTIDELDQLVSSGQITQDSKLRKDGMEHFVPATTIPGLFATDSRGDENANAAEARDVSDLPGTVGAFPDSVFQVEWSELPETRRYSDFPDAVRAVDALNGGEYDTAIEKAKSLCLANPDFHAGYCYLAGAFHSRGQSNAARKVVHEGLKRSRSNLSLLKLLGDLERDAGNATQAAIHYVQSIVLQKSSDQTDHTPYLVLGHMADFVGLSTVSDHLLKKSDTIQPGQFRLSGDAVVRLNTSISKVKDPRLPALLRALHRWLKLGDESSLSKNIVGTMPNTSDSKKNAIWYVMLEGRQEGPLTAAELRKRACSNEITPNSQIRSSCPKNETGAA